jgi:hypothetical protein
MVQPVSDAAIYTNTTLALNPRIGKIERYFQQSPEIYQPNGGNALYVFELLSQDGE